jgi:hypothetical protein
VPRQSKFRPPKVTSPPTRYEVWWLDANFDHDYDGPARDFESSLVLLPHLGYHVGTKKDHIVLAGEASIEDGQTNVRDLMTIPIVHIREMKKLFTQEEYDATLEGKAEHRKEHQDGGGARETA